MSGGYFCRSMRNYQVSNLNINRLIGNRLSFIEPLYFKHKEQKFFEFDISSILNKRLEDIKTNNISKQSREVLVKYPHDEIIFNLTASELFGELNLWFFDQNESVYQITSLGFLTRPKVPNGIFGKKDIISIKISSKDDYLKLNYNTMGQDFKSTLFGGIHPNLSRVYFAKKIKSSFVFVDVTITISVEVDKTSREILEAKNFNLEELENKIYARRKDLAMPLSVFFLNVPNYFEDPSLYLSRLDLNKFQFKTEEAHLRFLQYVYLNPHKIIDYSAVEEFKRLDDCIISSFSVSK